MVDAGKKRKSNGSLSTGAKKKSITPVTPSTPRGMSPTPTSSSPYTPSHPPKTSGLGYGNTSHVAGADVLSFRGEKSVLTVQVSVCCLVVVVLWRLCALVRDTHFARRMECLFWRGKTIT